MSTELSYNELHGKKIAAARKAKNLTQTEMASLIGKELNQTYSLRQYHKLEKGNFPKYKSDVLQAVYKILGLNTSAIKIEERVQNDSTLSESPQILEEELSKFDTEIQLKILHEKLKKQEEKEKIVVQFYERWMYDLLLEIQSLKSQLKSSKIDFKEVSKNN